MPSSKVKVAIAKVLKDEGYIDGFKVAGEQAKPELEIALQVLRRPAGDREDRARVASRGCASTRARTTFRAVMNGLGIAIVSTSQGVMTDRKARATGVGGEVLCIVA